MNLDRTLVDALHLDGYLAGITDEQAGLLLDRGHARYVGSTGRWVLTDAGIVAARQVEAELTADELAAIEGEH